MKNREADDRDDFESILPEYGRRKLLTCAESIRELAESFQETRENREILPEESRNDFLCQRRLFENKNLMAEHLQEMAQIMTDVAQETKVFDEYVDFHEPPPLTKSIALRMQPSILRYSNCENRPTRSIPRSRQNSRTTATFFR